MRAPKSEISVNEWNFKPLFHRHPLPVQEWELRAATVYEYGRESSSIRRLAKKYASLPKENLGNGEALLSEWTVEKKLKQFMILQFWKLIFWPGIFPRVPWLDVPIGERMERVEIYRNACEDVVVQVKGLDELQDWERAFSPALGGRQFSSKNEHVLFSLNWAFSNSELINAIGNWVRKNRPSNFEEPRTAASRDNVAHSRLKRLGIMRLLNAYPYNKAAAEAGRNGMSFPSASNALKARSQVTSDMYAIFQNESFIRQRSRPPIPKGALPIHWKTFSEQENA